MASHSTDRATWLLIMCAPNQLQVHSWFINTVFHHCVCVFIVTAKSTNLQCSTSEQLTHLHAFQAVLSLTELTSKSFTLTP